MKKKHACVLLCAALCSVQFSAGQAAVQKTAVPAKENAAAESDIKPASAEDWKQLALLAGDSYAEQFALFLAAGASVSDSQPYALAECLWYECFGKPALSAEEAVSEPQLALNAAVSDFIRVVGSGTAVPHVQSDAVYAFFLWLVSSSPRPPASAAVPAMPVLEASGLFSKPADEARKVSLYRASAKLEKLKRNAAALYPDIETAVLPAETVSQIVSDSALLYVLSRSESAAPVYRALQRVSAGNSAADAEGILLENCRSLGIEYGFALQSVLPAYSAGIASLAEQDDFAFCYISERDAGLLSADIAWLADCVPLYMERFIKLLYRPSGGQEVNR